MNRVAGVVRHALAGPHPSSSPSCRRAFSLYEQINLLDKVAEDTRRVRVTGYGDDGFDVNGVFHQGAVICLSSLTLMWWPTTLKEVTPESLSLFQLLRPAPDILLLGCGRKIERIGNDVREFLGSNGIKLEAIDSVMPQLSCRLFFQYSSFSDFLQIQRVVFIIDGSWDGKHMYTAAHCWFA